jgi:isocitrate dehydrogenase (NAD+)
MVKVTLIRGDGIGPEIADATLEVIAATGAKIEWDERAAGFGAIGRDAPPRNRTSCR